MLLFKNTSDYNPGKQILKVILKKDANCVISFSQLLSKTSFIKFIF